MSDLFGEHDDGTPLDGDERDGLLQTWITHRRDLNVAEQANIAKAAAWARRGKRRRAPDLLTETSARSLHKRMFGDVWRWAGTYRRKARNIGIDAHRIHAEVPALLDDVRFWMEHATWPSDEIAVRLHHRLVFVHPFPNGNGRHARLMADLLIERLGGVAFSWGGRTLADGSTLRAAYVSALRAADGHDLAPLLTFARA